MPAHDTGNAQAFNRGCDGRIHGQRYNDCPFASGTVEWYLWRRGWLDVAHHYGEDVAGRWLYRALPKLN